MRTNRLWAVQASALAMALALAGCGGGGGSVASTPLAPNYPTLASLSGTWSARGARLDDVRLNNASVPTYSADSPNIEINYDSASQTYSIRSVTGSGVTASTYGPSQRVSGDPKRYDATTVSNGATTVSRLTLGLSNVNLTYSDIGLWETGLTSASGDQDFHNVYFSYGVRTRSDDMPTSGTASYNLRLVGGGVGAPIVGAGSLSANFSAGSVSLSISPEYFYRPGQASNVFATLTGTGTINSSAASFDSSVAGNGYNGDVHGLFYGPRAVEVGGSFLIRNTGGNVVGIGAISGSRN